MFTENIVEKRLPWESLLLPFYCAPQAHQTMSKVS